MNCVILQPSYIPWRGYFHQIQKADLFIFYDDVTFGGAGWRNRNRVKTADGQKWLTIPVTVPPPGQLHKTPISEVQICNDRQWRTAHWKTLQQSYSKAPHFSRYAPHLETFYQTSHSQFSESVITLTQIMAKELAISGTRFAKSSDIGSVGAKSDRLIHVLKSVGASHYITGPAARNYLDQSLFDAAGITVEYMVYDYPEYEQLYPPYDPAVSILDLLFMKGPEAPRYIWG